MLTIAITDWQGYPTVYSLLVEINQNVSTVLSQYTMLFQKARDPLSGAPAEFATTVENLISLCGQVDAELQRVTDESIDVAQWQIYVANLDNLFRTWWRLPAFYNTGNDLSLVGTVSSDEVTISADDTWQTVESLSGASWGDIAQQNEMSGDAEAQSDWVGKKVLVPRSGSMQMAPIPGVLGNQSGIAVLGRDIANTLLLETSEKEPTFRCVLATDMTSSSVSAIQVSDVSDVPSSGGYIRIESELIAYSTVGSATNSITITSRGARGTVGAAHLSGAIVSVVPIIDDIAVLDYTDTFIQGLNNALTSNSVERAMGGDYGAVKAGIITIAVLSALKRDARVASITNTKITIDRDMINVSLDAHSIGRLATYTLQTYYHGEP